MRTRLLYALQVADFQSSITNASGGQGGSFRENRPVKHLDPRQKLLFKAVMEETYESDYMYKIRTARST
jgi:hypothetical protein